MISYGDEEAQESIDHLVCKLLALRRGRFGEEILQTLEFGPTNILLLKTEASRGI